MTKNKKQQEPKDNKVDIQTTEAEVTPEERIAELEVEIAELKDKYIRQWRSLRISATVATGRRRIGSSSPLKSWLSKYVMF